MITIVIADDEKLIRAGISKILKDSSEVPLELLEARNGEEALKLCREERPDVLITDIRMPIMDGIELMKNASQLDPRPSIIVLSGYDDFVYAKEAIKSGAMAYILKPVDKKELVTSVREAISSHRDIEQKKNEETLKNIIDEGRLSTEGPDINKFPNGYYCVSVIGNRCRKEAEAALVGTEYYILENRKDYVCIVIPKESRMLIDSSISLNEMITGISSAGSSLAMLREIKKQSFCSALKYYFTDKKEIFCYTSAGTKKGPYTDKMYEQLVSRLDISSTEEILGQINNLFDFSSALEEDKPIILEYIYTRICSDLLLRFPDFSKDAYLQLKGIMIENIWQYKDLSEWISCVSDYLIYLSELMHKNTTSYPYIDEALEYIKKNYSKNINMSMVANHVSVNYTWFSEKFKEQTGQNFNDYLKKLRIDTACILLKKGCYRIYEVSAKTGFSDVKYFARTFKEMTGSAPSDWMKSHSD